MGDHGLGTSKWAKARNTYGGGYQRKKNTQNWICPACEFTNVEWRRECHQCARPRSSTHGSVPSDLLNSDLFYTAPPFQSYSANPNPLSQCPPRTSTPPARWISTPKPLDAQNGQVQDISVAEEGLSASKWAPRRRNGSGNEVWTRYARNRRSSISNSTYSTTPTSGLDLPYQVQHYILELIQRVCEEGCFDFATRWIPEKLRQKGWDCARAAEPKMWREFLPSSIPPSAIAPVSCYTLEAELQNVVIIRNAAAHRRLVDNTEIQRFALQARDLMGIFSDVSRQEKLQYLSAQLIAWNAKSRNDDAGARADLEVALVAIGEKPVDDMDWTPNEVSLRELPDEEVKIHHERVVSGDPMDLDWDAL